MAFKGNYLIPSTKSSALFATAPFDIVVAASGGDYTLPSAAFNAGGSGKSYFIQAGTYTEDADVIIPSNAYIYWEPQNGGVTIDFNNATNTFKTAVVNVGASITATLSTSTFSVGTADLADMEANPSLYQLAYKGHLYQVASASDSANTITITGTPVLSDAGATNYVVWGKNWTQKTKMEGLLSLVNSADAYYEMGGNLYLCDYGGLVVNVDRMTYVNGVVNSNVGKLVSDGVTLAGAPAAHCIFPNGCQSMRGFFVVKNQAMNDATNYTGVRLFNSQLCVIDVDISLLNNAGAGTFTGLNCGGAVQSVVIGTVLNCEALTSNVTTVNTATLRTT